MAVLLIPTSADPFYTQVTNLDGTDFQLEFRFNQREQCFYLSVATEDGTPLATGVKLVPNWPLLQRFVDPRLPRGVLMVACTSADTSPPGLEELGEGRRCELIYFTADEVGANG